LWPCSPACCWRGGPRAGDPRRQGGDYLKRNELNSAREAIDVAAKDQTTGADPRTWHIRGFVYKELYKNSPQTADFRETALASLRRCGELDAKNTYAARNQAVLEYLYGTYYNEAVEQLNRKEFARSLAGFRSSSSTAPARSPTNITPKPSTTPGTLRMPW
jgi:hypothetical protein